MTDFVATSDGKVGFRKAEYHMHTFDENIDSKKYELILWTTHYPSGRITRYKNPADGRKAAAEISKQLLS